MALLASAVGAATGAAIIVGLDLYAPPFRSAWTLHLITTPLATGLLALHILQSRRRPGLAREGAHYGWRRPLLVGALPVLALAVGATALGIERSGAWRARLLTREHALLPMDEGFVARTERSCGNCHRSAPDEGHGDGSMSASPMANGPFLFVTDVLDDLPAHEFVANTLMLSRKQRHREQFRYDTHSSRSCLPCHVQTLRILTEGRLDDVLQDHYDSWRESPAAAPTWLSSVAQNPKKQRIVAMLSGDSSPGGWLKMEAELAPESGKARAILVRTSLTDDRGEEILEMGTDGPEDAPQLGHRFEDERGRPILDHRLWAVRRVVDQGHIPTDGFHELRVALPDVEFVARFAHPPLEGMPSVDAAGGLPIVEVGRVSARLE